MRKHLTMLLLIGFLLLSVSEALADESNVLRVTTWGGSYKNTYEMVAPLFEKEFNAKLEWEVGSSDAFQVKARLGQVDVVTNDLARSIDGEIEGLWMELDPNRIPNMANLYKIARYSKNFIFTNIGDYTLVYNSKKIKKSPTSWEDLWDSAYKNRVAMYYLLNSGTLSLMIMKAQQKGGGVDNIDPGFNRLIDLYKSGNTIGWLKAETELVSLFELEEAWIGMLTNGRVKGLWDKGKDFIKIVRPKEGTFGMITTLNVVKTTKNPNLAMKFVNFALSPAVQEAYAKNNFYAPTVKNAKIPAELKDVLLSGESIDNLFIPNWTAVNKVKAQWAERWDKTVSK